MIAARELLRKYFLWETFRPVATAAVDALVVPVPSLVHTTTVSHTLIVNTKHVNNNPDTPQTVPPQTDKVLVLDHTPF